MSYRVGGSSTDNITGEQIRSEGIKKHRIEQSKWFRTAQQMPPTPNPLKFLGQCTFPRSSNCSLLSSSFSMHLVGPMPISKELKLNYWFNSFLVINFLELWNKLLFFAMQLKTIAKLPSKTKFLDSVKRKFQKLEIHEFFIAEILPPQ